MTVTVWDLILCGRSGNARSDVFEIGIVLIQSLGLGDASGTTRREASRCEPS